MSALSRIAQLHRELAEAYDQLEREAATAGDDWIDQAQSPLGARLHCRLIRSGAIPGSQLGRRMLARRSVIDAYIEQHRVEPGEPVIGKEDEDEALLRRAGMRAA